MKHKSKDYKLNAIDCYLTEDKSQEEVCKIFKCSKNELKEDSNDFIFIESLYYYKFMSFPISKLYLYKFK